MKSYFKKMLQAVAILLASVGCSLVVLVLVYTKMRPATGPDDGALFDSLLASFFILLPGGIVSLYFMIEGIVGLLKDLFKVSTIDFTQTKSLN
jgi:hypothetical protein